MSKDVKVAIIYYSSTGTNYKLAKKAEEAAKEAGSEVKLLKVKELAPEEAINSNPEWKKHYEETKDIPEVDLEDLLWADAYIFSMPTRYGAVPAQMRQFLDTTGGLWAEGKLVNKVASAMTSASNPHGGQEQTILNLYTTLYHWGVIVAAPGYTDSSLFEAGGNPYGTSVTVDQEGNWKEDVSSAVKHQTKRTLQVASAIKNSLQ
ncbi:NAD(P)H:quinone oxidoreductase [Sutcliffiella rhizosphaerae]|uniref:NAD(P)H dehydrogenase (Quinone) n=1 Tax=Sutcliffiella rhizosphaerae TaxID=2880967 RepID=A0ABM8YPG7_9BACI|nr:NAD(P)H:quinone oxidoreductase [Sutcliffiella rhizosphaerae]CAG9621787.1 NAD(P)H dehydrogenase (quinone) [Sutcliffiella rhizosphaerae]